jgi:hypothetical protein
MSAAPRLSSLSDLGSCRKFSTNGKFRTLHRLRQRCSWCGTALCDYDLERAAVPQGQDPRPAMWETGALVQVDGNASWVLDHEDGDEVPGNACARLDDAVTV